MNTDKNNTQLPQSSVSVSAFLTGKAETDFEPFCVSTIRKMEGIGDRFFDHTIMAEFSKFPESFKTALMIDFFDSIGIFIIIQKLVYEPLFDVHVNGLKNQITSGSFDTRTEATSEAIRIANELYNTKFVEAEH